MYKIGSTVKTEFGIGVVKGKYENLNNHFVVNIRDVDIIVHVNEMEHYKTAHDRLIEIGYKVTRNVNAFITYELDNNVITFLKDEKIVQTHAIDDNLTFVMDLKLSHILTQYLEELENENTSK